jgi:hypothetical protein
LGRRFLHDENESPRGDAGGIRSVDCASVGRAKEHRRLQFRLDGYCVAFLEVGGGVVTATILRIQPSVLHSRYSSPSPPAQAGHWHDHRHIECHRRKGRAFACSARACRLWRGKRPPRCRTSSALSAAHWGRKLSKRVVVGPVGDPGLHRQC